MSDARFEDGEARPLRLVAFEAGDLEVISALAQDAVFPASEMGWTARDRRFAILLNRFRWEDAPAAERAGRVFERVQAVLTIEQVEHVQSQGVPQRDADTVMSLLSVSFDAAEGEDPGGRVLLTLAGDALIALEVEALEVTLRDVTRPYAAPSRARPRHDA
ncbi:MAG: DUF2948 family protein [Shimia sp.]